MYAADFLARPDKAEMKALNAHVLSDFVSDGHITLIGWRYAALMARSCVMKYYARRVDAQMVDELQSIAVLKIAEFYIKADRAHAEIRSMRNAVFTCARCACSNALYRARRGIACGEAIEDLADRLGGIGWAPERPRPAAKCKPRVPRECERKPKQLLLFGRTVAGPRRPIMLYPLGEVCSPRGIRKRWAVVRHARRIKAIRARRWVRP